MFPVHTDIALQLAREHAADERRRATLHHPTRQARTPRAGRARHARRVRLTGFRRDRRQESGS